MKILATGVLLAWLWTLIPVMLGLCGARKRGRDSAEAQSKPWVWDDRHAALAHDPSLPDSHPLSRLGRSPSQPVG
jgi:hypothetical protein